MNLSCELPTMAIHLTGKLTPVANGKQKALVLSAANEPVWSRCRGRIMIPGRLAREYDSRTVVYSNTLSIKDTGRSPSLAEIFSASLRKHL